MIPVRERPTFCVYPDGHKVRPLAEQLAVLRTAFPELGQATHAPVTEALPEGAEGWFLVPRWERLATDYSQAFRRMIDMPGREIINECVSQDWDGPTGYEAWHPMVHRPLTAYKMALIGHHQRDHDILVIPAQFGLQHRDGFIANATDGFSAREFHLGAFAVASMIVTHPCRIRYRDDEERRLSMLAAGDGVCIADFEDVRSWGAGRFGFYHDRRKHGSRPLFEAVSRSVYPGESGCVTGFH